MGVSGTLAMSTKAVTYGQFLLFAFFSSVDKTKMASSVLLPLLNPNCSMPIRPLDSAASVMLLHILIVINLSKLLGIVIGRYWAGWRESPP